VRNIHTHTTNAAGQASEAIAFMISAAKAYPFI
jgi:hypothetical protein